MSFIQIIEFDAADLDKVRDVDRQWKDATTGKRTARRQIIAQDHGRPGRYVVFVFFDSYESAMENSNLPETQRFAEMYGTVTRGTSFRDLDVVSDEPL